MAMSDMTGIASVDRVKAEDLELVDPATLEPHPDNPRTHDDATILRSIQDHGVIDVCVVQRSRRRILGGHGRWENAQAAGATSIPVLWVDCDDAEAEEILLVLNRAADQAGYQNEALARMLGRIKDSGRDIARTGWSGDELRTFIARYRATQRADTDAEEVPEPPATPMSKPGDLWCLGAHRVLCGDATLLPDVERLMGNGLAEMVWTDPPYGVAYEGKTDRKLTIKNDGAGAYEAVLMGAFDSILAACIAGAAVYVLALAGPAGIPFAVGLYERQMFRQRLVWVKNSMVLGHSDYHYKHEDIYVGYTPGAGRRGRGGDGWYGDNSQTSVLEFDRPSRSPDHPTVKPVALISYCLTNSSRAGAVVLDLFGGSGSTLIACEQTGRVARLMEIDPAYCDVIVTRWETLTGEKATRA